MNNRFSLWRNDKIPYGTYYAFTNLRYLFDSAEVGINRVAPENFAYRDDTLGLYVIISHSIIPTEQELRAIFDYAASGNHVFLSALNFGDNLLDSLHLSLSQRYEPYEPDSLTVGIRNGSAGNFVLYSYPGFSMDRFISGMDSSITRIAGINDRGKANFVRFEYKSGGSLGIHLAPAALTNFFLLHKDNKKYFDMVMSSVPASIRKIRWDDYFRQHISGADGSKRSAFSKLAAFLHHPVLRWAFWMAIVLFALVYLFESKRKQRPVPVVPELRNSSLDFVQTIGRLYFQRRDNQNLAAKMSVHFLGQVRSKYNIPTSRTDEDFEQRLAFKSGHPLQRVKEITGFIRNVEESSQISDDDLLAFSKRINEFYKQT